MTDALTQREEDPAPETPSPRGSHLQVGAAVRVRGLNLPLTGQIIEHEYDQWWVKFSHEGTSRYFRYRSDELELI